MDLANFRTLGHSTMMLGPFHNNTSGTQTEYSDSGQAAGCFAAAAHATEAKDPSESEIPFP